MNREGLNCIVHDFEYVVDKVNYIEEWKCKNCPERVCHFIECL